MDGEDFIVEEESNDINIDESKIEHETTEAEPEELTESQAQAQAQAPAKEARKSVQKVTKKKTRQEFYNIPKKNSGTKFYKKSRTDEDFKVVDIDEYLSVSESISGSSNTFNCVHGPDGKKYTEKGLLKRNLLKNLDPLPINSKWNDECPPSFDWGIAEKLETMVQSPTVELQRDRLKAHIRDFGRTSSNGYRVDTLKSFCTIVDYLLESVKRVPDLKEDLVLLLQNLRKPILLKTSSEVYKYFDFISHYLGFMGYLLIRIEDDDLFELVADAILWHLSAPDKVRGLGAVQLRYALAAAAPVLQQTIVRMIAVATTQRFPVFLQIAFLLACDTMDNCVALMKENIIENIFYRFNPYFPERHLPNYDINPMDCHDCNVKLGDSSLNMDTTLSLLLVLLKTSKQFLDKNPEHRKLLPAPDCYAQRCFVWAYRYECRASGHTHERITMTVVAAVLLECFGDRLLLFSSILMPDVMSLSVLTELPPRSDWVGTVNFNTSQLDVQFKKILIYFVVDFFKVFPYNKFMLESRYWLMGIMYLLDPGLCFLRARWSPPLFAELRKTALQALVCILPTAEHKLVKQYGLIRRILWYIEWYSESPYEIPVLYWCLRVLQVATYQRKDVERYTAMADLFETHGIIILIHLCYTLLEQKLPPMEKSQAVISICLRLLAGSVNQNKRLTCCVYPAIKWPASINNLAKRLLDVVLYSLEKHYLISNMWLITILNFIWEAIIWRQAYRELFVANDGIYKLLDIITMTNAPVQCIALAMVCDIARAGDGVGQLVSWRANLGASNAHPMVVKRGANIVSLLASVFRNECIASGVKLNEYGVLQDMDYPIMSVSVQDALSNTDLLYMKSHRTPVCLAAADLAGSRMPKAYAILHLLSEDLEYRVSLADETYNLYKNIQLDVEDETILVLCSHYLTLKLSEVWKETRMQSFELVDVDDFILDDFINIGKGWAKDIKRQQEDVIAKDRKKDCDEENSLYAFLGRIRLNIALDALRSVRCVARSTDRQRITQAQIHDAVIAHHRRHVYTKKNNAALLKTYKPPLDDQNITGQNVKVNSIYPKHKLKTLQPSSTSNTNSSSSSKS